VNDGAAGPSLSDQGELSASQYRGELSASQFGVDQEPERIRQLALLHEPDQNCLPELGELAAFRMPEQARGDYFQRESQVALVSQVGRGVGECIRLFPGQQIEGRRCFFPAGSSYFPPRRRVPLPARRLGLPACPCLPSAS
jgi:hypothetical protein